MRSILKHSVVALTVFTVAAQAANAQFVQQSARPVGGVTTTWEGVSGNNYTNGNVRVSTVFGTFNTGPYIAGSPWSGGFIDGQALLFAPGNLILSYSFTSAIHSFGTQAWNNNAGTTMTLAAYFQGGLVGSFDLATGGNGAANANQAATFAFSSTQAVDLVMLSSSGEFAVNQLDTDGNAGPIVVTPEPTSAAMLAGALAALGFVVRRRNKRSV